MTDNVPCGSAEGPFAPVAPAVSVATAGVAAKAGTTGPFEEFPAMAAERDGAGNGPQAAEPPSFPPAGLPLRKKLILHGVDIDAGAGVIRPDAVPVLNEAVTLLDTEAPIVVIADEPTSRVGRRQRSWRRRAEVVRSFLVSHGVPASHVMIGGVDQIQARVSCDARAQNCPTELYVN